VGYRSSFFMAQTVRFLLSNPGQSTTGDRRTGMDLRNAFSKYPQRCSIRRGDCEPRLRRFQQFQLAGHARLGLLFTTQEGSDLFLDRADRARKAQSWNAFVFRCRCNNRAIDAAKPFRKGALSPRGTEWRRHLMMNAEPRAQMQSRPPVSVFP